MAHYMDCARSMRVAINEQFAVLPGERPGGRGVYVYTDRSVSFVPFGMPHVQEGDIQEFLLRTRVPGVGELFLSVREGKPGSKSRVPPGVSYETGSIPEAYPETPALMVIDGRARAVLSQVLKKRVSAIKDFIDDKNRYSTPIEAQRAFERDRAVYLEKLERCRVEGDPDLHAAVNDEVLKLKRGHPGATVWEREITARPAFAVPVVSSVR